MKFWEKVFDIQGKILERREKRLERLSHSKFMKISDIIAAIGIIVIAIVVIIGFITFDKQNKKELKLYDINNTFTYVVRDTFYQNISVNFDTIKNTAIINIPASVTYNSIGYHLMNLKITLYNTNSKKLLTYTNYDDTFVEPQKIIKDYEIEIPLKNIKKEKIKYISLEHEIDPKPQPINTAGTITFIFLILITGCFSVVLLTKYILKIKRGIIVTGKVIDSRMRSIYTGDGFEITKFVTIEYFINNERFICEDSLLNMFSNDTPGKEYKVLHNQNNQNKSRLLKNVIFIMIFGLIFLGLTLGMIYGLLKLLLII